MIEFSIYFNISTEWETYFTQLHVQPIIHETVSFFLPLQYAQHYQEAIFFQFQHNTSKLQEKMTTTRYKISKAFDTLC